MASLFLPSWLAPTPPTPRETLYVDADLGRVFVPKALTDLVSLPGRATRRAAAGEVGIFVAKQHRPVYDDWGLLKGFLLLWSSVTHYERVDKGAEIQSNRCFGYAGGSTANGVFTAVAVASAALTKAKGDLSLGSTSANATTNEFTTIGLSRAAGSVGAYTAPSSLGGTFSQVISKVFTASGSGTAHGAGLFDSTTVSGSFLYVEDNFASTAVLVSSDTLTVTITITN